MGKSYINNEHWHSYKSLSFKIWDCSNRGLIWLFNLLYFALFVVRIARFFSISVLFTTEWLALL